MTPSDTRSPLFARFVALLGPGATVLDVACGDGAWTSALLRARLRVIAADLDGQTAALAAKNVRATAATTTETAGISAPPGMAPAGAMLTGSVLTGAVFVEADMMELPLAEGSLDGVWCGYGFSRVRPDRRAVFFRLAHRALKPHGLLYIAARTRPPGEMARRYAYERLLLRIPVLFGEYVERAPLAPDHAVIEAPEREHTPPLMLDQDRVPPAALERGAAWRYRAMTPALALRALCREHGFQVLALRRDGARWLLLARKKG